MQNNPQFISTAQLQVGLYIHLDLGWMDHPFTSSNFKIKDKSQIDKIKNIGLSRLRYDPNRSDCAPLPLKDKLTSAVKTAAPVIETPAKAVTNPPPAVDRLDALNASIAQTEKKFLVASQVVKSINKNIAAAPKLSVEQANSVVNDLLDTVLMEGDVVIHAMNCNRSSDSHYEHSLNVTVMALMLAKSLDIGKEDVRLLGLSAILHDIGKAEVSDKVLTKKEDLTEQERAHYQEHVSFGQRLIKEAGLPFRVGRVIGEHHEFSDGSGYPLGLTATKLDPLSNLVIICNTFDNLCNPTNVHTAQSPYEALNYMFAKQRSKFQDGLLKHLIKSLGIYPPESIVKLSNGEYAVVVSGNPSQPLRPFVRMYKAGAGASIEEASASPIVDLREEKDVSIIACVKANKLPDEVLRQLRPNNRVTYFIDNEKSETKH